MNDRNWEVVLYAQLLLETTTKPTSTTLETADFMYYGMNSPKQVMENHPTRIARNGVFMILHPSNATTLTSHFN